MPQISEIVFLRIHESYTILSTLILNSPIRLFFLLVKLYNEIGTHTHTHTHTNKHTSAQIDPSCKVNDPSKEREKKNWEKEGLGE